MAIVLFLMRQMPNLRWPSDDRRMFSDRIECDDYMRGYLQLAAFRDQRLSQRLGLRYLKPKAWMHSKWS